MSKWLRTATVFATGTEARALAKRVVARDHATVEAAMHGDRERMRIEMTRRLREPHVVLGVTPEARTPRRALLIHGYNE